MPEVIFETYDYGIIHYQVIRKNSNFDTITASIEPPDAPPLDKLEGYFHDLKYATVYTLTVEVAIGSKTDCGRTNPDDLRVSQKMKTALTRNVYC